MARSRGKEKPKRLTAKRKLEIYLETRDKDANIGEILRRYGIHLDDLRQIEAAVEAGAMRELKKRGPGRNKKYVDIDAKDMEKLEKELAKKEKALAEMTVLFTQLKKKDEQDS